MNGFEFIAQHIRDHAESKKAEFKAKLQLRWPGTWPDEVTDLYARFCAAIDAKVDEYLDVFRALDELAVEAADTINKISVAAAAGDTDEVERLALAFLARNLPSLSK